MIRECGWFDLGNLYRLLKLLKELACFACGKFNFSQNLAFRVIAVLYDSVMFALAYTVFIINDPCHIAVRKVYNL